MIIHKKKTRASLSGYFDNDEKKKHLKSYEARCMLRQKATFLDFSKDINLIHRVLPSITDIKKNIKHNLSSDNEIKDKAN